MRKQSGLIFILCLMLSKNAQSTPGDAAESGSGISLPAAHQPKHFEDMLSSLSVRLKAMQAELGLDDISKGFADLQIRLWYWGIRQKKIVVIRRLGKNWSGFIYTLELEWAGQTTPALSKKIKQVAPNSGWQNFSKNLFDLQILSLPDQQKLPGYHMAVDASQYYVETATNDRYQCYSYYDPGENRQKLWQANNMTKILALCEKELGIWH